MSEKELIAEAVRQELKFLVRNDILPTPENYEIFFHIFYEIVKNNKNLSDEEILKLGKKEKGVIKESKNIIENVDRLTTGVSQNMKEHDKLIKEHVNVLKESKEDIVEELFTKVMKKLDELKRSNDKLIKEVENYKSQINSLKKALYATKEEADKDPLTGLCNRRCFERNVSFMFNDFKEYGFPLSICIIDIDNFKKINDTYGHDVGDLALKYLAKNITSTIRNNDIAARYGGEEFVIAFSGIIGEKAKEVCERIRSKIESNPLILGNEDKIEFTVSIGIEEAKESHESILDIIRSADKKLYEAKKTGKNKVVF